MTRRQAGGELDPPEAERAEQPAIQGPLTALSPAQVLALQRSGVGNRLLARGLNGDVDEEEEQEAEGGDAPVVVLENKPPEHGETKKKRKKRKGGGASAETKPPIAEMTLEEQLAEIEKAGTQEPAKGKKKGGASRPAAPKKSEAQKKHEKEQRARKQQEKAGDAERERKQREREQEEQDKETTARTGLTQMLGALLTTLEGLRDNLPNQPAYDDIWQEAEDRCNALGPFVNVDATEQTASSTELRAQADQTTSLISKVRNFEPPETPAQRRARKFEEMKGNVTLAFQREAWSGPMGGETDFGVDKTDTAMRTLVRNHYGRDRVEVPGHETREYPGKTSTSKVFYYVTGTSNTQGIAYDISLHAWDGDAPLGTVHVLHIPHKVD